MAAHGAALRVHYLPLPVAFRSRGGFGTHWMFARNVRVTNPLLTSAPDWRQSLLGLAGDEHAQDHVDLDHAQVLVIWRALFDPRDPMCSRAQAIVRDPTLAPAGWTPEVQQVARWICGHDDRRNRPALRPDYQVDAWRGVVSELGRLQ